MSHESEHQQTMTVHAGDLYTAPDFADAQIRVMRVARDGSWADIRVTPLSGARSWTKRQQLQDGQLPYRVSNVGLAIASAAERVDHGTHPVEGIGSESAKWRGLRG